MFGFILFLRFRVLIYYCAMQMDSIQPSMSLNTSSGLEMKQVRGTYYDQKKGVEWSLNKSRVKNWKLNYKFWYSSQGVARAVEELIQQGEMNREHAIKFLHDIKLGTDYLENTYSNKENSRVLDVMVSLTNGVKLSSDFSKIWFLGQTYF